jgi:hypothetical protein
VVSVLHDESNIIPRGQSVNLFGPERILIDSTTFSKKGPYVLSARVVDSETAEKLDQKGFTFHVETEPLEKGIFEDMLPYGFNEGEYQYSLGFVDTSSSGGLVLNYNVHHPGYLAVEDDAVDIISEYLFRFAALELARIDINSEQPKIVDIDTERLRESDYLLERFSLIMGKLMYYYHKGSA